MDLPAFRAHMCNFINFLKDEQAPRAKAPERWVCELTWSLYCREMTVSKLGLFACSGKCSGDQTKGQEVTQH